MKDANNPMETIIEKTERESNDIDIINQAKQDFIMKTTKDLKIGDRILLAYGNQEDDLAGCRNFSKVMLWQSIGSSYKPWEADVVEIAKDDYENGIFFARVYGFEDEMGSCYLHDVLAVKNEKGEWEEIELNEGEKELQKVVDETLDKR